ncbi:AAA family ATPase [Pseudomonas sp. 2822-17]|uniref:AAA family ATPase n=1 Tax=Pseudomonas sp. 2822-17 TaxID=1712678 RepID=UPI000C161A9E|nr:AAA family ATPase [Pseudomonas sp. 2822-17]PIB49916.1 hypothetical protein AOA60_28100 [Pseudomonas sp. 2822-17]
MNPKFKNLTISGWRQFHNVSVDFHPRLTVITGANGAGKSSLLGLLTQHFGWQKIFLGTPLKRRINGVARFLSGFRRRKSIHSHEQEVGNISYSNDTGASIRTATEGIQFAVSIHNQQPVLGTFISSHRPPPVFQQISQINVYAISADNAYAQYHGESIQRSQGQSHGPGPIFRLKETLVSIAHFGAKTDYSSGDPAAIEILNGFSRVLKEILPPSLGFKEISIRMTDVVLETETGNFLMDAASGGVMAIIDIGWQIYIYSLTSGVSGADGFTVVMDEPENHLHPSMQRSLLGNLMKAFPTAQFIVATHSPFMVSSVQDSTVYVLRYVSVEESQDDLDLDDGLPFTKLVYSERLDVINRAGSASDILRDVLGVPVTVPAWVEEELNSLITEFRSVELSVENLAELRRRMASLGFGELYPQALSKLVEDK